MGEPHEADGTLVTTIIGNDGVRWACRICNETVYQKGDGWLHFDHSLDLPAPTTQAGEVRRDG